MYIYVIYSISIAFNCCRMYNVNVLIFVLILKKAPARPISKNRLIPCNFLIIHIH